MSSVSSPPGPLEPRIISIACDHAGFGLKQEIVHLLRELKAEVVDLGLLKVRHVVRCINRIRQPHTAVLQTDR